MPPFDKVAFTLKTDEISTPVHTQYGWHIIQALSADHAGEDDAARRAVKESIRQQLLQTKKTTVDDGLGQQPEEGLREEDRVPGGLRAVGDDDQRDDHRLT